MESNSVTCRTCGGKNGNHVPSLLDKDGVGAAGHKISVQGVTDSEDYCHRCGGPNVRWSAPSPLWNAVMRGNDINGDWEWDEIICPTCFCVLAEERGVASGLFRLYASRVSAELKTVTPSGRVWDEEKWLWVEPEEYKSNEYPSGAHPIIKKLIDKVDYHGTLNMIVDGVTYTITRNATARLQAP